MGSSLSGRLRTKMLMVEEHIKGTTELKKIVKKTKFGVIKRDD
jgi:hypothetical protein